MRERERKRRTIVYQKNSLLKKIFIKKNFKFKISQKNVKSNQKH